MHVSAGDKAQEEGQGRTEEGVCDVGRGRAQKGRNTELGGRREGHTSQLCHQPAMRLERSTYPQRGPILWPIKWRGVRARGCVSRLQRQIHRERRRKGVWENFVEEKTRGNGSGSKAAIVVDESPGECYGGRTGCGDVSGIQGHDYQHLMSWG